MYLIYVNKTTSLKKVLVIGSYVYLCIFFSNEEALMKAFEMYDKNGDFFTLNVDMKWHFMTHLLNKGQ